MAQTRLAQDAIDPYQYRNEATHTNLSEDEEEEDGFDLVVEREMDDAFVRRWPCPWVVLGVWNLAGILGVVQMPRKIQSTPRDSRDRH